ncbi:MAG: outer membrane beta-barrel protein [Pyrinomonadaceae bacterium]
MRKALYIALFFVFCAPLAHAQDYQRGEIGAGYSANWVDTQGAFSTNNNDNSRDLFHGFYVNGGGNFSRYWGIQAEVSHNRKTTDFTSTTGLPSQLRGQLTQFVAGVKLQDNSADTKVRPFARALFGVAHASGDFNVGTTTGSDSDNGFAAVIGGGVAFRLNHSVDFVTSADWNPNHFSNNGTGIGGVGGNTGSGWDHNFRAGLGLNFRFGGK